MHASQEDVVDKGHGDPSQPSSSLQQQAPPLRPYISKRSRAAAAATTTTPTTSTSATPKPSLPKYIGTRSIPVPDSFLQKKSYSEPQDSSSLSNSTTNTTTQAQSLSNIQTKLSQLSNAASNDKQSSTITRSTESDISTSRAYYIREASSSSSSRSTQSLAQQPFPKPKAPLPTIIMHKVGPGVSLDQAKQSVAVHKRKVVGTVEYLHRKKQELLALEKEKEEKEEKEKEKETKRRRKG